MFLNNRTLGIAAMAGAPFLCLDFLIHSGNGGSVQYGHTPLSGLFNLIYISAWMGSIIGLTRVQVLGQTWLSRFIPVLQLVFLAFAKSWTIYEMIQPAANTTLYYVLNAFWLLSHLLMLGLGIEVLVNGMLSGWKRYVPLLVGLWLPVTLLAQWLAGPTAFSLAFSGCYSALTWGMLGYVVFGEREMSRELILVQVLIRPLSSKRIFQD